jgi:hypothetical protein
MPGPVLAARFNVRTRRAVRLEARLCGAGDRHHSPGVPGSRDPESRPVQAPRAGRTSRSKRWTGFIVTNVAPPEPRTAVELSPGIKLLYCGFMGGEGRFTDAIWET